MKLDAVASNYDQAAGYYDKLTGFVFQTLLRKEKKYRRKTVDHLGDITGKRVLDIGCGTGRNFPYLVPAVGVRGEIVGLDYSQGMLDQARQLVSHRHWHNVTLIRGDAAEIATGNELFDAAISTWCLGIVHDLDAALNQAISRVKPGGRIAIMDFQGAKPEHGPLRWFYPFYSYLLRQAGIDSREDVDDARLRAKWEQGRKLLESRLTDIVMETYLQGLGFVLAGTVKSG